jgi:hypothetical protein
VEIMMLLSAAILKARPVMLAPIRTSIVLNRMMGQTEIALALVVRLELIRMVGLVIFVLLVVTLELLFVRNLLNF